MIDYFVAFISLFYVVGFGLLGYGLWGARRSTRAKAWPTADGILTSAEVHESSNSDGSTFEVRVQYTYTANGVAYQGKRLAFGYGSGGMREAQEIYGRLKAGKTVTVRYDPSNPSVSCLLVGLHRSIRFLLAFSVAWLLFLIVFTLLFWLSS